MELVTTAQMRELDQSTIELGTAGLTLMERAGAGVVAALLARHRTACRAGVVVVAGRGNNGGDGFVVARLLESRGVRASVVLLGERRRVLGDAAVNLERWVSGGGRLVEVGSPEELERLEREIEDAGLVVDALFGTGLNAEVMGLPAAAIAAINRAAERPSRAAGAARSRRSKASVPPGACPVVAVDVPSGLDGDTGEPWGCAVHATETVTLGLAKLGLVLPAARPFVGRLEVVDIGLAEPALAALAPLARSASAPDLAGLVPRRRATQHKGSHGHLLIFGGSPGKSGAAVLAGRGALRGGAGLVSIACSAPVQAVVAAAMPELMSEPIDGFSREDWQRLLASRSAAVAGPGLGQADEVRETVRWLAAKAGLPLVIDADGLNALAGATDVLRGAAAPRVLTPHPGEMARLRGTSVGEVQRERHRVALALARETGAVVVLKGSGTLSAAPDGRLEVNTSGGPLLGTGGTGDVLAGLIGGLLAQGLAAFDAARLGVWLHGRAGDRLAERLGDAGLLASELADELPMARHELTSLGL